MIRFTENGVLKEFATREAFDIYIDSITPTAEKAKTLSINQKAARIAFGNGLVDDYKADNDVLGFDTLTRLERKAINSKLRKVFNELNEGYLKDAIEEIRETVNADFDGIYVRKSRYLKLRNNIHEYLGQPVVLSYNS